jgi:uncharacterized membrane protein
MRHISRYVLSGIITIIPLWITWLAIEFVFRHLLRIGEPVLRAARQWIAGMLPAFSAEISWPLANKLLAIVLTIAIFYALGRFASHVFGRRFIGLVEAGLDRIPLVKSIYGGVRKLISALGSEPDGGRKAQRVVLINFPTEQMKTVGLVTRTMEEEGTGRTLAIVYVPTTPNPTSGYLEIVPIDQVISTDWTLDEAMNFVITAGAVAPSRPIRYADNPPLTVATRRSDASAVQESQAI